MNIQISHLSLILQRTLKDSRSAAMLLVALFPFFFGAALVYFASQEYYPQLKEWAGIALQDYALYPWLAWIVSKLMDILLSMGILVIFIFLVVLLQLFMGIFTAPLVIKFIHARYYSHLTLHEQGLFTSLRDFARILIRALLYLPFCVIFSLIPLVGALAWGVLFFYLFYQTIMLDVADSILTAQEKRQIALHQKWKMTLFIAGIYLFSLIPFFNLIVPTFQILAFGHFIMQQKEALLTEAKLPKHDI